MKHFKLEKSQDEFYTSNSGLALLGLCINNFTSLTRHSFRQSTQRSCPEPAVSPHHADLDLLRLEKHATLHLHTRARSVSARSGATSFVHEREHPGVPEEEHF